MYFKLKEDYIISTRLCLKSKQSNSLIIFYDRPNKHLTLDIIFEIPQKITLYICFYGQFLELK